MTTTHRIPFNKPYLAPGTLEAVSRVLATGDIAGDGPAGKEAERLICSLFGAGHALLTTSCTHALEMATLILDLAPGDEVILPSYTFVSGANAVIRGGGKPVFCDIDPSTLTIDVADAERRISPRTRAIMPTHYAGVAAEMEGLLAVAHGNGLVVVEDAAQGVNATYRGKFLGTIGDCGAYSFHGTKNYISGEGGAFVTRDEQRARRAEIVREKGTNRSNFLRGEVDKYTWVSHGSSYVQSDLLAAVLACQLGALAPIQLERKRVWDAYMSGLRPLEARERLRLPIVPSHCTTNYHIFYILLRDEADRLNVMRSLKERGIGTTFHYVPLHSSPYALRALGTKGLRLPVTDDVFARLLRLPIYPQLTVEEVS